jgi:hypothetical protein
VGERITRSFERANVTLHQEVFGGECSHPRLSASRTAWTGRLRPWSSPSAGEGMPRAEVLIPGSSETVSVGSPAGPGSS